MKVVNPNSTTHLIGIIPRYYGFGVTVLSLKNLSENVSDEVAHTIQMVSGFADITFDYAFNERDKYSITLTEGDEVVYRGLLFATDQETQDFDITKNYFSYE